MKEKIYQVFHKQDNTYPLAIVSCFTVLQVAILIIFGYTPYPDSEGYLALAKECIEQDDYYPAKTLLYHYAFLWNIGAINLIILSLKLFQTVWPLLLFYSLIKGATAWFVYRIVRQLTNYPIALITLLLYCFYPANYGEGTSLLSEIPFTFLTFSALFLALCKNYYVPAGLLLAVAAWIRPFSLFFTVSLCLYLLINNRQWKHCLQIISGYVLMIIVIGSLSQLRTGLFLYQAKTGWMALSQYSWDHSPNSHDNFSLNPNDICSDSTLNIVEKDKAWQSYFFRWLSDNKSEYVMQMPRKLIDTYISDNVNMCAFLPNKSQRSYLYEELSLRTLVQQAPHYSIVQWLTVFNLFYYYLLLLLSLSSLRHYRNDTHLLPCITIVISTIILLLVGHGEARFHQTYMPFIIMLAALELGYILKKSLPVT